MQPDKLNSFITCSQASTLRHSSNQASAIHIDSICVCFAFSLHRTDFQQNIFASVYMQKKKNWRKINIESRLALLAWKRKWAGHSNDERPMKMLRDACRRDGAC